MRDSQLKTVICFSFFVLFFRIDTVSSYLARVKIFEKSHRVDVEMYKNCKPMRKRDPVNIDEGDAPRAPNDKAEFVSVAFAGIRRGDSRDLRLILIIDNFHSTIPVRSSTGNIGEISDTLAKCAPTGLYIFQDKAETIFSSRKSTAGIDNRLSRCSVPEVIPEG